MQQGVRFRFMLAFENRTLAGYFEQFDKDEDGHLSLPEVKEMFRLVEEKMKGARREVNESPKSVFMLIPLCRATRLSASCSPCPSPVCYAHGGMLLESSGAV